MPANPDLDEWVFDTVKASTIAPRKNTTKRRKLSVIHANGQGIYEGPGPEDALKRLDLKDSPLEYSSPPPVTVKRGTVRKQPSIVQLATPVKQRQSSVQKRPLQPDMSFGNTGSTVRLFRRVSDNSTTAQVSSDDAASGSIRDENRPPMTETATKEAVLGRRIFNKIVDPGFQEIHAQTSNQAKREALSRLADAWSALDAVDPEGEYQLMKLLIDRAQSDSKLSSLFTSAKGSLKDGTPQGTPKRPAAKLVLAQSNPHLQSHRRRQVSSQPEVEKLACLPGQVIPGMEHTKQLADVLYGRWSDGLRNKWPAI
jgi:serine/threonine-protein kinase 24/25/MST4